MSETRYAASAVVVDDKIYLVGGSRRFEQSIDMYDPKNDTWNLIKPINALNIGRRPLVVYG
jgi:hypothetical protein